MRARSRRSPAARTGRWLACLLLGLLAAPAWADPADEAEAWVRELYYEGLPLEPAAGLDDAAVARLIELLEDPAEAAHHGNVVLALGASGHRDAYPALAAFADDAPAGEVDRATFRARTQLRLAFGYLARHDARALRWLLEPGDGAPPAWHFRRQRGEALRVLLDELTLTGLALSGSPTAAARLEQVIDASRGRDPAARRRLRHAEGASEVYRQARDELAGRGSGR
jgi:hypothetical protein